MIFEAMAPPLLSVIIPTANRPQFLPFAIRSALAGMGDDVEVIVVPNGKDNSWKQSAAALQHDVRVHFRPISTANANSARNHGLEKAQGTLIRFLDDDDRLMPDGAIKQYRYLLKSDVDICSGAVERVDDRGSGLGVMQQQDQNDLVRAMARPERVCLPVAHVFRREAIRGLRWDETLPYEQDTNWMMLLCAEREWKWSVLPDRVGEWTQHAASRTSWKISRATRARLTADLFLNVLTRLRQQGRLTNTRADAFAEAFWHYVVQNSFRAPKYWSQIARQAYLLSPCRRPEGALYRSNLVASLDPGKVELLLSPWRGAMHYGTVLSTIARRRGRQ